MCTTDDFRLQLTLLHNDAFALEAAKRTDNIQQSSNQTGKTVINSEFIDRAKVEDSKLTFTCAESVHL